jgi:anti-sigma factor NepR-like protein
MGEMSGSGEGKRPVTGRQGKPAQPDDFPLHEHIGRQLKAMFDEVVEEPVPPKLKELLEELERNKPKP